MIASEKFSALFDILFGKQTSDVQARAFPVRQSILSTKQYTGSNEKIDANFKILLKSIFYLRLHIQIAA